jgi:hypothetical protein
LALDSMLTQGVFLNTGNITFSFLSYAGAVISNLHPLAQIATYLSGTTQGGSSQRLQHRLQRCSGS